MLRPALEPAVAARDRERRTPGEAGVWVFILGDMTVFAVFFGAFLVARSKQPAVFAASREDLVVTFGAVNTLLLLTSSLLVARAVRAHRAARSRQAVSLVGGAGVCALAFVVLKGVEWGERLSHHTTPGTNDFFMYYFALTGVHLLHLLLGSAGLAVLWRTVRRPAPRPADRLIVECVASYWHMVDLLWVVIFPLLYFAST